MRQWGLEKSVTYSGLPPLGGKARTRILISFLCGTMNRNIPCFLSVQAKECTVAGIIGWFFSLIGWISTSLEQWEWLESGWDGAKLWSSIRETTLLLGNNSFKADLARSCSPPGWGRQRCDPLAAGNWPSSPFCSWVETGSLHLTFGPLIAPVDTLSKSY